MQYRFGITFFMIIFLSAFAAVRPAHAQESDTFQWSVMPYLWGSKTQLDLTLRGNDLGGTEISFSDLLDVLDTAVMLQVEAGKGHWSYFGDLTYLETSNSIIRPDAVVDSDSTQVILDAAAAYWPDGVGSTLNFYGGLRFTDFDDRYRITPNNGQPATDLRSAPSYYDLLVGARYRFDLSERWQLLTQGDLSFGDSEGQYLLRANLVYLVGSRRQNRIMVGYQYKQADFEDGDLRKDFTYFGPMASFDFRF